MNQVLFVPFQGPIRAVGTQNLNGCTAVAIISNYGAILAHIPPLPYVTTNPHVGMQNLQARVAEMMAAYQQHVDYFPAAASSLVVGAFFGGQAALPHHLEHIRVSLTQRGLIPRLRLYQVTAGGHPTPAQGTVFIDARWGPPVVYVENQPVRLT